MLEGKISEDEVNTHSLERETSEITSLLKQFPANTNVLVVDTNFATLLNMKQLMRKYSYQVTIEADAEKALAFLTSCKHEINIVFWDYHMPEIDGLQALQRIGSKMGLPVVIMSDDNQIESVMKATVHGACDYVLKPVKEDVIANIWQHIVRKKMMSKPEVISPVQSDLVQSDGLEQDKDDSKIVDQEQNIHKEEERVVKRSWIKWTEEIQPISDLLQFNDLDLTWIEESEPVRSDLVQTNNSDRMWTGETQPVQSDLVRINDLDQHKDYSKTLNQDNDKKDEREAKKRRMIWAEETQSVQTDLVKTDGFNEDNIVQKFEKEEEKRGRKPRMQWTKDLDKKFLQAIDMVGGIEKANPKLLLECLRDMNIEGLTRNNVASHLQKHRIALEESQIPQESGLSTTYRPAPSLQGSNNVHTSISPYPMSGRAVNPIQQNQYQNGYLTMNNNNQFITNPQPSLPYFGHHSRQPQQQQHQSSSQFNYLTSNEEFGQASDIFAPDLQLPYPNLQDLGHTYPNLPDRGRTYPNLQNRGHTYQNLPYV